jgi:hypothetical protein
VEAPPVFRGGYCFGQPFTRAAGVAAKIITMPMDTAKKHLQVKLCRALQTIDPYIRSRFRECPTTTASHMRDTLPQ